MADGVVRWEAGAQLQERIHPKMRFTWCGGIKHNGTLAGAVRAFMRLPADSQMNCDVFTDADTVEGFTSGLLSFKELSALAMRPDLPL